MADARCPACKGPIAVPARVQQHQRVRCPHCRKKFRLARPRGGVAPEQMDPALPPQTALLSDGMPQLVASLLATGVTVGVCVASNQLDGWGFLGLYAGLFAVLGGLLFGLGHVVGRRLAGGLATAAFLVVGIYRFTTGRGVGDMELMLPAMIFGAIVLLAVGGYEMDWLED